MINITVEEKDNRIDFSNLGVGATFITDYHLTKDSAVFLRVESPLNTFKDKCTNAVSTEGKTFSFSEDMQVSVVNIEGKVELV